MPKPDAAAMAAARSAIATALRQRELLASRRAVEHLAALHAASPAGSASAPAHAEIGDLWSMLGEYGRARECYDRAIELAPTEARYWFNRAAVRRFLGELSEAEADYDRTLQLAPHDSQAYLNRSELRVQSESNNHIAQLEAQLAPSMSWQREVPIRYAIAKEYEDLGEYAKSWHHLTAGARLRRQHLQYDLRTDLATVDWIRTAFPQGSIFEGGDPSREPIFIVGMPRTGSTLVERILSSHSLVFAAGELQDFGAAVVEAVGARLGRGASRQELIATSATLDSVALGRDYLRRTRPRTGGTPHFTDKLPINYLYLGLIARALPNAKLVHVTRDPIATCFGMFKVLFEQGYPFSYDLNELADYYIGYRRLMQHWQAALPGRVIDFEYEALVANAAVAAPKLVQAVGLQWQPQCLEFHNNPSAVATASAAQVRRPIYDSAVSLWRNYQGLAPLIARLKAAGIVSSVE
jgi:tetratricopeptide (TPR) repeat protein